MLGPYIRLGSTAIDVGAGMGYFSIPLARLVGQQVMLPPLTFRPKCLKPSPAELAEMEFQKESDPTFANSDSLGNHSKVDFVIAFWKVHEVPNQRAFLTEVYGFLKPEGLFLLAEPIFHESKKSFVQTMNIASEIGFILKVMPKIRLSRSVLLARNQSGNDRSIPQGRHNESSMS